MRYFWGVIFLTVPIVGVGMFIYSYVRTSGWLPPNVSSVGDEIDFLFYFILAVTGIVFLLTELLLVYAMVTATGRNGGKSTYTHGSKSLEIAWTVLTAAILLFIAFYQVPTWARAKFFWQFKEKHPDVKPTALVIASQFQWETRQGLWDEEANKPGDFNWKNPNFRDSFVMYNELHIPAGEPVLIYLTTRDVIHSFWVPSLRVKQDALPGTVIPVWFDAAKLKPEDFGPDKTKVFEWVCAELCGWGHYRMRAKVVVHATKEDYYAWLKQKSQEHLTVKPDKGI